MSDTTVIRKQIDYEIEMSAGEMGTIFANEVSSFQAGVINSAAQTMNEWPDSRGSFQIAYITPSLSTAGRRFIREMADHLEEG